MTGRSAGRMRSGRVHSAANRENSSKKTKLKPWLVKRWWIGKITGDYIWHMEDVLDLYEQPDDPLPPVVCVDEQPCNFWVMCWHRFR